VRDAGVLGIPHEVRGEVPKAVVVLNDGYTASETLAKDIENHVKERLAKYEYPREIAFVEELPRTRTGKVRRDALRETEESR
jgi:acetyl-CoA synthetase